MEKPRCYWCHRYHDIMIEKQLIKVTRWGFSTLEETELFCSDKCYASAQVYLRMYERYSLLSIGIMAAVIFGIIKSFTLSRSLNVSHLHLLTLIILPLGLLLLAVPFTTPEAVQYVGLKKGIWMTRIIGIIIIILGFALHWIKKI